MFKIEYYRNLIKYFLINLSMIVDKFFPCFPDSHLFDVCIYCNFKLYSNLFLNDTRLKLGRILVKKISNIWFSDSLQGFPINPDV